MFAPVDNDIKLYHRIGNKNGLEATELIKSIVNNGLVKEIQLPNTCIFSTTTGAGIIYPNFTVATVYRVTAVTTNGGFFIENGTTYNTPLSFYMGNGTQYGTTPLYYANIASTASAVQDINSGSGGPATPYGFNTNTYVIQILTFSTIEKKLSKNCLQLQIILYSICNTLCNTDAK